MFLFTETVTKEVKSKVAIKTLPNTTKLKSLKQLNI